MSNPRLIVNLFSSKAVKKCRFIHWFSGVRRYSRRTMKILCVIQPWASLIIMGGRNARTGAIELKDVENRTWRTTDNASRANSRPCLTKSDDMTSEEVEHRFGVQLPAELSLGGIVGMTEIFDCVRPRPSKWYAPGCYGFVLANSQPLPFVRRVRSRFGGRRLSCSGC